MVDSAKLLVVPYERHRFFEELDTLIAQLPGELTPVADAFRANLEAVTRFVSVPYRVVHVALLPEFNEKVRAGMRDAWSSGKLEDGLVGILQAKADSLGAFNERLFQEIIPETREQARRRAEEALRDEDVQLGVRELFLQALVLIWGAFEVLARDTFKVVLNMKPELLKNLNQDDRGRKLVKGVRLDLSALAEWQYDLSGRLGEFLASQLPMERLTNLRDLYNAIFPGEQSLAKGLKDPRLHLLAQRRHLIVHRRGIIDQEYLENTSDSYSLGEKLEVDVDVLRAALTVANDVGLSLIRAAASSLGQENALEDLPSQ